VKLSTEESEESLRAFESSDSFVRNSDCLLPTIGNLGSIPMIRFVEKGRGIVSAATEGASLFRAIQTW
jgi:hypothetical protein